MWFLVWFIITVTALVSLWASLTIALGIAVCLAMLGVTIVIGFTFFPHSDREEALHFANTTEDEVIAGGLVLILIATLMGIGIVIAKMAGAT